LTKTTMQNCEKKIIAVKIIQVAYMRFIGDNPI